MDAALFTAMLRDKHLFDWRRLQYKYGEEAVREFFSLLDEGFWQELPLWSGGKRPVFLPCVLPNTTATVKLLLTDPGTQAATVEEIESSLRIENIHSSRESIQRILQGYAPGNRDETMVLGMKRGLEFISNRDNALTEENLHRLYMLTVGDYLPEEDRLLPGRYYRHGSVYVVGTELGHTGASPKVLPEAMAALFAFINAEDGMDELVKAAIIHFMLAWLHPWFDGNGRTARLLHLWYLLQRGYSASLYVPFSSYINDSRNEYYKAFRTVEDNMRFFGRMDVTPFILYCIEHIYHCFPKRLSARDAESLLPPDTATEKERALWAFVLRSYGEAGFSTKQLERDFANAAYATIRSFVLKFTELGLLEKVQGGNRPKYRVRG